jgi:hypothetical protein
VPVERGQFVDANTGEIYLKLRQVDLDDVDAILGFVNEYGTLGIRANDFAAVREVPFTFTALRLLEEAADGPVTEAENPSLAEESLSEFRFAARWLYDLTELWRVCAGAVKPNEVTWSIVASDDIAGPTQAAFFLRDALAHALQPFHARLIVRIDAEPSPEVEWAGVPLFSICALELFNHVREQATYKSCANCGRLFVRQEGRARYSQHRTEGLRFCSKRCNDQHKQRDYRTRQRSKKGGPNG